MTDDKDDKSLCMRGTLNHVEIQVRDLAPAIGEWGWLLEALGWVPYQCWDEGRSWKSGDTYIVVASTRLTGSHDRRRPGLSHFAFHAGSRGDVDQLWQKGPSHGWRHLYEDRHPFAGGEDWHVAYMENSERFKIELVADDAENDEVAG